jgi:hypothetical protein
MDGKEWKFGKQVSISGLDQRFGAKDIGFLGNGVTYRILEDATKGLTNASIYCSLGMMGQRDEKGRVKV